MHDYQKPDRGWYGDPTRGASMGRASDLPSDAEGVLSLRLVPLDEGGYDPGGVYWGSGDPLWCVGDGERVLYVRGKSAAEVRQAFPEATWRNELAPGDLDDAVEGYLRTAIFASTGDDDEPLDSGHTVDDFDPGAVAVMRKTVEGFLAAHSGKLRVVADGDWFGVGGNIWYDQNGHGCGFRDVKGHDRETAALSQAAQALGETYLFVGCDGKIHVDHPSLAATLPAGAP